MLSFLNLSGNRFFKGLTALPFDSLQELDFSSNCMKDEGAARIAAFAPQCQQLQKPNLRHNKIALSGAQALAVAVTRFPVLQRLDLRNNVYGKEGFDCLWKVDRSLYQSSMRQLLLDTRSHDFEYYDEHYMNAVTADEVRYCDENRYDQDIYAVGTEI